MTNEEKPLVSCIRQHKNGCVVMMELSAEGYFETNMESVKSLVDEGFSGVYISFQRPFKNVSLLLGEKSVDISKLLFIDAATVLSEEQQEESKQCINISPEIDIDELVRAIYTSIPMLKSNEKFIFIDSLTTIALYKPLSETLRFSEFLMRTIKRQEENVSLIFNVAKDLAQKRFIKDIALGVDEIIVK